jgi:ABC-type hemin transport system ATPase subunit
MVTHDVSLKNFADRVIWMRDGKIMRLEIIPKEVREMRLKQLDNDLEVQTHFCFFSPLSLLSHCLYVLCFLIFI